LVGNSANGTYRNQLSSDDYVIATNGNNVAIMLGAYTTEVFYIISHNNGQTWSKQVVAPFPIQGVHAIDFDDYPNGMTDTINTSDNSHSIAIDNNGVVHVAFGLFHWKVADADSYTYWPGMGYGIVYWNSNYTNEQGGHEIPLFGSFSGDANHPEWMANGIGYTLIPERIVELSQAGNNQSNLCVFGIIDENGNGYMDYENLTGASWHYRTLGLATMPGISVDESGRLAIIYSVLSETRISDLTGFSYRSAYVTYRDQNGQWNYDAINLTSGYEHQYDEVYSVFASPKGYNGSFWMGYSADEYQGLYLDINDNYPYSNNGVLTDNYIYVVKVSPWGNLPSYTITATANPTNGGTVTGGGTYVQGSTCNLQATPNSGYSFVKWTKNGTQVSTNPNYSFTVTGNASYVAHFQQNTTYYTVDATPSPSDAGIITGTGQYTSGSTCNLQAIPNNGYSFVNWIENGAAVSTNATYSFTVTGNRNLIAVFDIATTYYNITAIANPTNGGSVTGGGTYQQGQSCTVSATANNGFTFTNWTENGNVISTNANYTFTVTGNRTLVANFQAQPQNYTISVSANPNNGGNVTGGGTYQQGQSCTVLASANDDFSFTNWTENDNVVSTNANYTFTVTDNRTLVANFQPQTYTITAIADPTNGGEVSGGGTYHAGSTCVLSAMPNDGFVFENWTCNDIVVSTSPSFDFEVNRDATYIAHFIQDASHCTITAIADPVEGGAVLGGNTYELGAICTLTAIAGVGYEFVNWTLNGSIVSTEPSFSFSVTSNAVYVAHFIRIVNHYTITASAEPASAGSVIGAGTFEEGESCTLIAMPNPTYSFVSWTENGIVISTDNPYSFTVERDRNFVAVFSQGLFYTITASAGVNGTISPEGNVFVEPGEDKTFAMIPNSGCQVSKVLVDGVDRGPIPSYTFRNVSGDHTIHVEFSGVGMDDAYDMGLRIYPNPANDYIIVEGTDMYEIILYDLLGIQQQHEEVNNNHVRITTDNLVAGTYILKVVCKDGRSGHLRFVVAR
jgi:uncharacterized repeat protein (TIGR02543 family)